MNAPKIKKLTPKKKVVAIFGSYNRQSVGDKAILVSLIDLLFRVSRIPLVIKVICFDAAAVQKELQNYSWAHCVHAISIFPSRIQGMMTENFGGAIKITTSLPKHFRTLLSIFSFIFKHSKKIAPDADLLIMGGGNLFMDLFPHWPVRPYAIARQFKRSHVPIVIAGVGAFPIKTRLGHNLLKAVARSADKVFVRDRETLRLFEDKWRIPAQAKPDLAFSLPLADRSGDMISSPQTIAVNIAPIYGPSWPYNDNAQYLSYLDSMAEGLYKYVSKQSKNCLLSFVDTNYPTDREGTIEVIRRLIEKGIEPIRIKYPDRLLSIQEVVREFQVANLAVFTRLHAGIMALVAGCPVIGVGYQPKVRDVMQNVGLGENVVSIDKLDELENHLSGIEHSEQKYILPRNSVAVLDEMNQNMVREALSCMS